MDKSYNVDDILSEIKSRKARKRAGQGAPRPDREPPAAVEREFAGDFVFRFPEEDAPEAPAPAWPAADFSTGEFRIAPPVPPPEKRRNPLEYEGHVRSITDRAKIRREQRAEEARQEQPPASTASDMSRTTRIDFSSFRPPAANEDGRTRILPRFGQSRELDLGDLRELDYGNVPGEPAEPWEDEDENRFGEAPEAPSLDFSEYNSVGDRTAVATDIARTKMWLFARCAFTGLVTAILFYLTFAGKYVMWLPELADPELNKRIYLLVIAVATALVALLNSSPLGGGLMSLFKMRANSDTLAALALLAAVGQSAMWVANHERVDAAALDLYCCVASLAMLFNALGKFSMINRIQQNFRIIASDKPKKAAMVAGSDEFCRAFVHEPSRRRPTVVYSVKSGFLTDFLALSYSDKYDVGVNRAVAPVCLLGALAVGAATWLLTGSPASSLSTLTAILCVSATLSSTFIENIPLGKLTARLAPQGGMVSGNKAVEDFCDMAAVVLSETDLFPEGSVQLHGIKTYSRGRVDEAILDAASVICSLDSALSPVFLQMIGRNRKLLKKVDNVVFENAMGVSAWVDSRRVLIGNRALMLNHGILLPPEGYEQKYAEQHGEVIYLSNSGELSAQFVVSYHMDEELAVQLDALAAREKTLVVYTVNPHITPKKLWELYGFPQELCRIMPAERHPEYSEMAKPRENTIAEIAYAGKAHTLIAALIACVNARSSILSATVLQMIQIVIGYGLVAFMAFMGAIHTLNIVELCVYQLFWFMVIFILQQMKSS